jgi:hypothetical protein
MDENRLAEIEARVNAAAPMPWSARHEGGGSYLTYDATPNPPYNRSGTYYIVKRSGFAKGVQSATADFIAHARQDVPALLAEVRRLREILGATT